MTRPTYVYSLPLPRHCCTSAYAYDGEHAIPKHILRDSEIEMHAELCTPVVFSGLLVWSGPEVEDGTGKTKRIRYTSRAENNKGGVAYTTNINVIGHVRLISLSLLPCTEMLLQSPPPMQYIPYQSAAWQTCRQHIVL